MGRRRVRWRNVGRVACLSAAGALSLTRPPEPPREPPRPAAPPARSLAAPPKAQRLPRLRDIPRLVLPRPRKRRASKGGDSGGKGGPSGVIGRYDEKVQKPPGEVR